MKVNGDAEGAKQTNEIKMAIPVLEAIDIRSKDISADALLTHRPLPGRGPAHALPLHRQRQPERLLDDLTFYFQTRQSPDAVTVDYAHGRIETRTIWTTTALNAYLDFPHVGQAFVIERETIDKKTGRDSCDTAYGLTSRPPDGSSLTGCS